MGNSECPGYIIIDHSFRWLEGFAGSSSEVSETQVGLGKWGSQASQLNPKSHDP